MAQPKTCHSSGRYVCPLIDKRVQHAATHSPSTPPTHQEFTSFGKALHIDTSGVAATAAASGAKGLGFRMTIEYNTGNQGEIHLCVCVLGVWHAAIVVATDC